MNTREGIPTVARPSGTDYSQEVDDESRVFITDHATPSPPVPVNLYFIHRLFTLCRASQSASALP